MIEILITSSVLITALLVLRKVFRNTLSRRVQYALWGLVLLRLLAPVSLPAVDFSVLTAAKPVEQTVARNIAARPVYVPVARAPLAEHPAAPDTAPEHTETPVGESVWVAQTEQTAVQYKRLSAQTVLAGLWLAGSAAAAVFLLAVNVRFWLKLRRTREPFPVEDCTLPVYLVEEGLSSPCLFGLFRPAIYLTPAVLASPERLRHVLAHETTHARHLDHIWTLLRGVCLAVYWFDPLVWAASAAAKTDCELACDEGVLARLGEADRIPYGQTLLSLIPVRRTVNPMLAATTMAAGKKQLKDRFTRIAQKPRQFAAAAVTVALLAGVVSACTFTGAKTPDVTLPNPGTGTDLADDGPLRSLTGAELRYFNEEIFNGTPIYDEYGGYIPYNICNQFANPLNIYDRPENIDLYELFYCEETTGLNDEELIAAFGYELAQDLPCGAYKLTTDEINRILTQYAGLTLDQTNQVGLENFIYLPDYDAYYWMHGDTNYPGEFMFSVGAREGNTIKLYQNSNFDVDWYCVTLAEQSDGSFWFVSNQRCEKPLIPTVFPAGEPEAVIPLDNLEPYEAPAVTIKTRLVDDFVDTYENRLENWDIDGHNVLVYRSVDGVINAAIRDRDAGTLNVFLTALGENTSVFFFNDLFGYNGFTVSYDGEISPHHYGTFVDYFYLTADGTPVRLIHTTYSYTESPIIDLNGDGTNELIASTEIFFQRNGQIYQADLHSLVMEVCPALDIWSYSQWDEYGKSLYICGTAYYDGAGRDIFRCLYFDGEQMLLFKDEKPYHDHMVDGIDKYVPDAVVDAAKAFVEENQSRFTSEDTVFDDWRVESFVHQYSRMFGNVTIDAWSFNYEQHTTTPDKIVLAGGRYLTEDGWASPGYPGCDWLFFQVEGEEYTLLWQEMINDMTPDSKAFQENLIQRLEQLGLNIQP